MLGMISTRDHLRISAVTKLLSLPKSCFYQLGNSLLKYPYSRVAPVKKWEIIHKEKFPAMVILQPVADNESFIMKKMNNAAEEIEPFTEKEAYGYSMHDLWPNCESLKTMDSFRKLEKPGQFFYLPPVKYVDHKQEFIREAYIYKLENNDVMAIYQNL